MTAEYVQPGNQLDPPAAPPDEVELPVRPEQERLVESPGLSPALTLALLNRLEALRDSQVLTFVARPDVTLRGDVVEHVYEQLREIGRVPRLDLFLHSAGGQTEIPWRLITLIRDFTEHFSVVIPGIAYSAATHLAMGADEIVMGPLSELSPVDPARSHPLLPAQQDGQPLAFSVQDLRQCVEFVKREIGDSAPDALAQILTALFEKVHPLAIGAMQQSYELARLISRKALSTHMDPIAERDQIERIVDAFAGEFFSHQYRIGWKEARDSGLKVTFAQDDLWETMWALYKNYQAFFVLARSIEDGKRAAQPVVWIDSTRRRRILEELYTAQAEGAGPVLWRKSTSQWLSTPWEAMPAALEV